MIGLTLLGILLFMASLFMILLILVQRGKGGGLTGALGGMGGQSAFGAKAGDVFTKITVVTAMVWITLSMVTIAVFNPPPNDGLETRKKNDQATMSSADDEDADKVGDDGDSMSATGEIEGESENDASDDVEPENLKDEMPDLTSDDENAEGEESATDQPADETDDSDNGGGPVLEDSLEPSTEKDSSSDNSDEDN